MGCGGTKSVGEQQAKQGVVTKETPLEPWTSVDPGKDAVDRPVTASTEGGEENLEPADLEKASSAPSDDGPPGPLPLCLEEEPDPLVPAEAVPGSILSPRKARPAPALSAHKAKQAKPSSPPESPPMKKVSEVLVKGVLDLGIKEVKEGGGPLVGSAHGGRRHEKDVEIIDISDEDAALDVFVPASVDLASIDQENSETQSGGVEYIA